MNRHLTRRHLLAGLAIGTLSAVGAAIAVPRYVTQPAAMDPTAQLMALLADQPAAARIGAAWREHHPAFFATAEMLPQHLAARLRRHGWRDEQAPHDSGQLGDLVTSIVRDDFRHGRVVDVAGWRLSTFQAELCGLAYLIRSQPSAA